MVTSIIEQSATSAPVGGVSAYVSALDLFSIGIGPSSSHTVGPMRAAATFADHLGSTGLLPEVTRITCSLYGSLGATGLGHGTPDAVLAGLTGALPEDCDPSDVRACWSGLAGNATLLVGGSQEVRIEKSDVSFEPRTRLPAHPNALTLFAWGETRDAPLLEETYYSIGGGFIRQDGDPVEPPATKPQRMPFTSSEQLLGLCDANGLDICDVARANEESMHSSDELDAGLDAIWAAMHGCVRAGLHATGGLLPGGLGVRRRAAAVRVQLEESAHLPEHLRDTATEWLHAFALAVNEENAAGGRVVTAPTNGAAGILPAVGHYYLRFVPGADTAGIHRFLLTAAAIGSLVKSNASISGAEGGCQAEVGTACAMASGALCAMLGGSPHQVENAAEIAMEHHLGLTCDPVGGLVQVPCIERNAIAASTAVSSALLAMHGDGTHVVSLDTVIETMRQTGQDMATKYKETSEGGLAVNFVLC